MIFKFFIFSRNFHIIVYAFLREMFEFFAKQIEAKCENFREKCKIVAKRFFFSL